ncbi:ATP phosphoribosyltransferase regulatory subunit [Cyanobium sp. NIES-981]|uniref:ATP phosphoribosyltransferase regulatory subunit n=1 Tax=Cyanobium sp. NIES-981 TaxID=1851505 RepID=UPI0007DD93FC|nr:ATP phosphoribosyltransferase regulatory subunit [Cyanobium sp. NIES-981]SBO42193.1 ATP phosphoribosyltransferase regulatory subunit [Cyanobium sp. NIES-981]
MALQPAAGARDLNPREVERNRRICGDLAAVYRRWGYQVVAPPGFERLDTLAAGGGIDSRELVRLAADEPLGLRPELTASIARAASTRLGSRPRPLRLWAEGPTFRSSVADTGLQRIHEQLQSGVELLGEPTAAADAELTRLLLAAAGSLGLRPEHRPRLLVGHHGVLKALLQQIPGPQQSGARAALTSFDPIALGQLNLNGSDRQRLMALMRLRGHATQVLYQLEQWLGPVPLLKDLGHTLAVLTPAAERLGVAVQLDPTFQPHFDLYDGLVLKLVCQGREAPVAIAGGGRYDALVGRFCGDAQIAAGVGFAFDVEAVRELLSSDSAAAVAAAEVAPDLVAYAEDTLLAAALEMLEGLHSRGTRAELLPGPVTSRTGAEAIAAERGSPRVHWLAP